MSENFDPSPVEIAEHERAAMEVTRLRRKGVQCHLESHPKGVQTQVEVIRDPDRQTADHRDPALSPAASSKDD